MKNNLYQDIEEILKSDDKFISKNGNLVKTKIYEALMKEQLDSDIVKLLLKNENIKKNFFVEIENVCVFDKQKFIWFVESEEFLPDSYTMYENVIGLTSNRKFISQKKDVVLDFPYKDCVLEGGQTKEDQKRDEIFYNEIIASEEITRMLSPKVFTNSKRFFKNKLEKSSIELKSNDNLIIKGNNLIVLSSLLDVYEGKIKCIYIDPPYNPSSDSNTFCYNNTYNHSSWLVFIKNRLEIAKKLLTKDGVLIVAIDKNEQAYLQVLLDEMFPEYDIDCITIVHNPRGANRTNFSYTHEYAIYVTPKGMKTIANRKLSNDEIDWSPLRNWGSESLRSDAKNCFYPIIVKDEKIVGFGDVIYDENEHPKAQTVKNGDYYYIYPIDSKGIERKWRYARQSIEEIKHLLRVKVTKTGYDIEIGKDFGLYTTVWIDSKYDANTYGTQLIKKLNPNTKFTYPKSLYNVKDCIEPVVREDKNAIILDFFGGSGTTGHAVMEINKDGGNRKFILVEQMDYAETETFERNMSVIKQENLDESIVYCELKENGQKLIDKIIDATNDNIDDIKKEIYSDERIVDYITKKELEDGDEIFQTLKLSEKKEALIHLINKNKLYVNLSDIEDEEYNISEEERKFTYSLYKGGK